MNDFVEITELPLFPKDITREWVKETLEKGEIAPKGRKMFVRRYDTSEEEDLWLYAQHGPQGDKEMTYAYHATPASLVPSYIKYGLIADSNSINLSAIRTQQVRNSARNLKDPPTGFNAVVVWRTNRGNVTERGGFNEAYLTPRKSVDPNSLPPNIREHFSRAKDLRQLPPDDIIGIFFLINKLTANKN
ncbi:hypothetical protein IPM62_01220 [Candidatus Woesebacteria bacterium]|nr:MAG: hypothetical protein IPM62_01220 [Candidatus Woesebacteria bacterium]